MGSGAHNTWKGCTETLLAGSILQDFSQVFILCTLNLNGMSGFIITRSSISSNAFLHD